MNPALASLTARKSGVWISLHLAWGFALGQSISKYGLGVSTDAAHYMFAGLNLADGRGLTLFGGAPYAQWPPLYPAALAGIHALSGWDMLAAAQALQWWTWLLLSLCISILCLRIFPQRFWLALSAALLAQSGTVMIFAFQSAGSDYLHLLFVLLFVWQAGDYMRAPGTSSLAGMLLFAALGTLTRYTGLTLLIMGALILVWKPGGSLWRRLARGLWMGLAALPSALWYLAVFNERGQGRPPISLVENVRTFTLSILGWWMPVPDSKPAQFFWILLFWLAFALAVSFFTRRPRDARRMNEYSMALLGYGFLYAATLFVVARLAYFNKLSDRFLLPLYIPMIVFLLLCIETFMTGTRRGANTRLVLGGAAVALISLPLLFFAYRAITQAQARGVAAGNLFNTSAWHENSALRYWKEHPPQGDFIVYANSPAGVAFHTWEDILASPRKFAGPFSDVQLPMPADLIPPGAQAYLIWIEPDAYSHLYTRAEINRAFQLIPLYEGADGGVYRLAPR
ncbi:MAG: hypothetical protein HFACDABA_02194 [Anaerolineales bacterium]|nr:hypothetical protein [Anaerolineales bacterium]